MPRTSFLHKSCPGRVCRFCLRVCCSRSTISPEMVWGTSPSSTAAPTWPRTLLISAKHWIHLCNALDPDSLRPGPAECAEAIKYKSKYTYTYTYTYKYTYTYTNTHTCTYTYTYTSSYSCVWCGIKCVTTRLHVWSDKFQCHLLPRMPPCNFIVFEHVTTKQTNVRTRKLCIECIFETPKLLWVARKILRPRGPWPLV